jgi:hypothetical protein
LDHREKYNKGNHLALRSGEPPRNEEGGKDELHPHTTRTPPNFPPGTAKKRKTTNVEDIQEHQSQVPILSSLNQNPTTDHSEMDLLKRQCAGQGSLLAVLKQMVDTGTSHRPPNMMVSAHKPSNRVRLQVPVSPLGLPVNCILLKLQGSTWMKHDVIFSRNKVRMRDSRTLRSITPILDMPSPTPQTHLKEFLPMN